ncbi:hypothetical protein IK1_05587 [Bacillus cereus VD146]|uniref:Uncharacterized protein n=1 Tax=Bacillus cereus (strain VD146) TaxID=1053236 RepID=R8NC70_BACCX|nr:hypothetical protein IK1_05587 [Bacillus cereus VD146]
MNKICCNCGSREIRQGSLDSQVYVNYPPFKVLTDCLKWGLLG